LSVFILRRFIQSIFVVFTMTVIVFFGVSVIGNPIDLFAPQECDQRCLADLKVRFGLDRPTDCSGRALARVESPVLHLEHATDGEPARRRRVLETQAISRPTAIT